MREAEDVAAVVDSIGESVNLLHHSYGGLCALEACLLTSHVRRLVLYEGVSFGGSRVPLRPLNPDGSYEACSPSLHSARAHLAVRGTPLRPITDCSVVCCGCSVGRRGGTAGG